MTTTRVLRPPRRAVQPSPGERARSLLGRDYLSYSAVSTYQKCPLKFCFQYVVSLEPEFVSSSLVFGSAIHAAIEHHFRKLFEGAEPPSCEELVAEYDRAWSAEPSATIRFGQGETPESLHDLAGRMLEVFWASSLSKLDTSAELLAVEEEFRGPIIPDCPDILGRVDLVLADAERLRIIDFKTSRSAWGDAKIQEALPQQLLYVELLRPLARSLGIDQIEMEWVVLTKTRNPGITLHTASPTPTDIAHTRATVRAVWHAIQAEHFYPCPSTINCPGCPFQQACRAWEG